MSAAMLQGCPATTLDTNLWLDLPTRQYIPVLPLCRKLGAAVRADTVVELSDGYGMRLVNHSSELIHQVYQREKVEDVAQWRDAVQFKP